MFNFFNNWTFWKTPPRGVGVGDLIAKNNLADVANITTARNNLGAASQSDVAMLKSLEAMNAKTGRFFFNGGTFQATKKQALGTAFSICRTLKIKWEDWESLADYRYFDGNNLGWGSNSTIGWGFAVISHRLFFYYRAIESGATILNLSTEQTKSIINGNVHTLIVTAGNNIFSIYVDGILIKSQTATQEIIDIPTPSYTQTIRQITGEYSRIKQFNFDMSASNAPYTIEDYCKGIEEPPSLNLGTNYKDANDFINNIFYRGSNVASVEIIDGKFTITKVEGDTSNYHILVKLDKPIRAGSRVKLKYSAGQVPYQIALHKNATPNTSEGYQPFATMQQAGTYYLTANTDYDYIMIYGLNSSSLLSFNYIELEVLGADYSYADFAMTRNDSTRIVLDNSGNGNYATISGDLASDKDSAVKTFIDELKTQFTQSTIA